MVDCFQQSTFLFIMGQSKLICVIGAAGSGKDTAANLLSCKYDFIHIKFTRALKEIMELAYGLPQGYLDSPEGKSQRIKKLDGSFYNFTYKDQLNTLFHVFHGNSNLDNELWIKLAMRHLRKILNTLESAKVVISDVRAPIEVDEILKFTNKFNIDTRVVRLFRKNSYRYSPDKYLEDNYHKFMENGIPVFDVANNQTIERLEESLRFCVFQNLDIDNSLVSR